MDKQLADKLREMLMQNAPYDTGQLKASIQEAQLSNNQWIITIGNGTTLTREVPSNVYASLLNNARNITYFTGPKGNQVPVKKQNRHYHWVNTQIRMWAFNNGLKLVMDIEEESEEDE